MSNPSSIGGARSVSSVYHTPRYSATLPINGGSLAAPRGTVSAASIQCPQIPPTFASSSRSLSPRASFPVSLPVRTCAHPSAATIMPQSSSCSRLSHESKVGEIRGGSASVPFPAPGRLSPKRLVPGIVHLPDRSTTGLDKPPKVQQGSLLRISSSVSVAPQRSLTVASTRSSVSPTPDRLPTESDGTSDAGRTSSMAALSGSVSTGFGGSLRVGMSAAGLSPSGFNGTSFGGSSWVIQPPPKALPTSSMSSTAGSHKTAVPTSSNRHVPLWRSIHQEGNSGTASAIKVLQTLLDQKTLGPTEKEDIQFSLDHFKKFMVQSQSRSYSAASGITTIELSKEECDLDRDTVAWLESIGKPTRRGRKITFRQVGLTILVCRKLVVARERPQVDLGTIVSLVAIGPLQVELMKLNSWQDFDIFKYTDLTGSYQFSLLDVVTVIFRSHLFVEQFGISLSVFRRFIAEVGRSYHDHPPYHNAMHAADVVQTLHVMLRERKGDIFSELELLCGIVAAIVHDVGHPGLTNSFHMSAQTEPALTYSENSINENMHCSITWRLLAKDGCDWMNVFLKDQTSFAKRTITSVILATDMDKHFANLQAFQQTVQVKGRHVARWCEPVRAMEQFVHAADLSNPGKKFEVAEKWTDRVVEEFFAQGDRERQLGLPISYLCDRNSVSRHGSQVGFVKFVVRPLFDSIKEFTKLQQALENLDDYADFHKARLADDSMLEREATLLLSPTKSSAISTPEVDHVRGIADDLFSNSDSDVETVEEAEQYERPRRNAVCGSKYGFWHRRTVNRFANPPIHPKTPAQHALLRQALMEDPIFESAVAYGHLDTLAAAIELETFYPGQNVVEQGNFGEADYFVVEGHLNCFKARPGVPPEQVAQCETGQHFGDDVLLWHSQWDFTVTVAPQPADKPAIVGKLDRSVYLNILVFGSMQEFEHRASCLHNCKLFESMSSEQIAKMVEVLKLRFYRPGEVVCKRGEAARHLFILESGECFLNQQPDTLKAGDLFGEKALVARHSWDDTVTAKTDVEILVLSVSKFERLFGPLNQCLKVHRAADPRHMIAEYLKSFRRERPSVSSHFAVFQKCQRGSISKLVHGRAVGRGPNINGRAAQKGVFSGCVPFLQVFDNARKVDIERSRANGRILIYYKSEQARAEALCVLQTCLDDIRGGVAMKLPKIMQEGYYAPYFWGLDLPEPVIHEAYIERADLNPCVGWEAGIDSEPAFMDMNFHAARDESKSPRVVLLQLDAEHAMNPHGLFMSYAEDSVKPVSGALDPFLVGAKGESYTKLPPKQVELAVWAVERATEILAHRQEHSWTQRWSAMLHENLSSYQKFEENVSCGDDVSAKFLLGLMKHTSSAGAVRQGLESFNFHFPQELSDEFLIIWNGFSDRSWRYVSEPELREFLRQRIHEDYTFPLNPVWALRDPGWFELMRVLCASRAAQKTLECWYPRESGLLAMIESTHMRFPEGFVSSQRMGFADEGPCISSSKQLVGLVLHETKRKFAGDKVQRKRNCKLGSSFASELTWASVKRSARSSQLDILRNVAG